MGVQGLFRPSVTSQSCSHHHGVVGEFARLCEFVMVTFFHVDCTILYRSFFPSRGVLSFGSHVLRGM